MILNLRKCLVVLTLLSAACGLSAQELAAPVTPKIRVGMLVPSQGSAAWNATRALREGVRAGHASDADRYELLTYTVSAPERVLEALNQAADDGAMLVIGPVLKGSVESVSKQPFLPLPVVAVNRASAEQLPELYMSVDITAEGEVPQLVKIALENTVLEGAGKSFVILSTPDSYDEQLARSIARELTALGVASEIRHISDEQIAYLREEMRGKDFRGVFFAMDPLKASAIRPYLPPELPAFGTSYTNPAGQRDAMSARTQASDLSGVITLEIPANTKINQAPYAQYQTELMQLGGDERHLFAVGVDAWRLGKGWLHWQKRQVLPDGLSGSIHFDKDSDSIAQRQLDKTVIRPEESNDGAVQFEEDSASAGL